jgi:ribonucleotide reductase beta subunit family protein with ferritin-like domain
MLQKILTPSTARFVQAKTEFPTLVAMYKKHEQSFWTANEIDLARDIADFNSLSPAESQYLKVILAFFAAADGMVNENIALNFYNEVQHVEIRSFYSFQIAMENIHAQTYKLLIQTYVSNDDEQNALFASVETHPSIAAKAKFCAKYMDATRFDFVTRLIAFACVEGIFFSSSFCSIFWFKKRLLMPGLCQSNDLISRDEALHALFPCELYRLIDVKSSFVHDIIMEAVTLECAFVESILPQPLDDMTAPSMCQYVRYCADILLGLLQEKPLFKVSNPYPWMNFIAIDGKSNFFETPETYKLGDFSKVFAVDVDV